MTKSQKLLNTIANLGKLTKKGLPPKNKDKKDKQILKEFER